jgi:hypothetical protein
MLHLNRGKRHMLWCNPFLLWCYRLETYAMMLHCLYFDSTLELRLETCAMMLPYLYFGTSSEAWDMCYDVTMSLFWCYTCSEAWDMSYDVTLSLFWCYTCSEAWDMCYDVVMSLFWCYTCYEAWDMLLWFLFYSFTFFAKYLLGINISAWLRRLWMKRGLWVKKLWFLLLLGNNRGLVSDGLVSCHPLYWGVCASLYLPEWGLTKGSKRCT